MQGGSGDRVVAGEEVVQEMNVARSHPERYAALVEEVRSRVRGNVAMLPDRTLMRLREGTRGLDETIRFLRQVGPRSPLAFSPGMSKAAADHCAEQRGGAMGHNGRSGSPADRIARYGKWETLWGENVSYGKRSARDVVLALIIDDGLPGKKHRKNIFNPVFSVAGAAMGPHARLRTVCSIEFAGGFAERDSVTDGPLFARNR